MGVRRARAAADDDAPEILLPLFSLTATPEEDAHGAFLAALVAGGAGGRTPGGRKQGGGMQGTRGPGGGGQGSRGPGGGGQGSRTQGPRTQNARFAASDPARVVLVDESAFLARWGADDPRRDERRAAWREFLDTHGARPVFVDLADPDPAAAESQLTEAASAPASDADGTDSGSAVGGSPR
jgi:hypothetical protein